MDQRYGTEVWNGSFKEVWNGGMERGYGTGVVPKLVPDLLFWLAPISKSKCTKHTILWPLLEVEMSKKCTPLWREAHFEVKMYTSSGPLLEGQMSFRVAGARDCAACQKCAERDGFVACPKTMAAVGHLKRICKDAFCVAGAVQETCSSELLGGPGADFLREVAFWSIRSSGLLIWFCMTGAALSQKCFVFDVVNFKH